MLVPEIKIFDDGAEFLFKAPFPEFSRVFSQEASYVGR
jgi:hypothetical protein